MCVMMSRHPPIRFIMPAGSAHPEPGTSMLPGHLMIILPALTRAAALESIRIHRGAGRRLCRDREWIQ